MLITSHFWCDLKKHWPLLATELKTFFMKQKLPQSLPNFARLFLPIWHLLSLNQRPCRKCSRWLVTPWCFVGGLSTSKWQKMTKWRLCWSPHISNNSMGALGRIPSRRVCQFTLIFFDRTCLKVFESKNISAKKSCFALNWFTSQLFPTQ